MKFYKCVRGTWFNYKGRRDFSPNQVVKVDPISEKKLKEVLDMHPNFKTHEVEPVLQPAVPRVEQLLTVPLPPNMMSRDDIMNEIATYGVRPDLYALDQVLEQQLSVLRTMTNKQYVTVVDKKGRPSYVQNIQEFIKEFKAHKEKTGQEDLAISDYTKDLLHNKSIEVVDEKEYHDKKKQEKGVTTAAVEKDDNKYEKDKKLKDFDEFLEGNKNQDEGDIDKIENKILIKSINQKAKINDETVPDELRYPTEKIKIENFTYLIANLGEGENQGVFCKKPLTEDEIKNCRYIKEWNTIPHSVLVNSLINRGVDIVAFKEENIDSFRNRALWHLKKLIVEEIPTRGDLPYIELNMLTKRNKEFEKTCPKSLTSCKKATLVSSMYSMKPYTDKSSEIFQVFNKEKVFTNKRKLFKLIHLGILFNIDFSKVTTMDEMEDLQKRMGLPTQISK